ncbi:MAG TPA: hypothetical protein VMH90_04285 [Thermoplasmata archaeon]|nr:hypothetical protein [Thermoplasmata archaeon]
MPRGIPVSLHDRKANLELLCQELEAEAARLTREESSLVERVRQAREQVRYYEDLLLQHRRSLGRPPTLARILRQLQ